MFLVVGLGNPGTKYERTRHNAGFLVLDEIANKYKNEGFVEKGNYYSANINIRRNKLELIKPVTYMNLSGEAVKKVIGKLAAQYEDFSPSKHLIVIHDDVDLEPGRIKVKDKGGDGGHNGIKSIVEHLGTSNFVRVRVGVGRPEYGTADYVLSDYTKEEFDVFTEDTAPRIIRFISEYLSVGLNKSRSRLLEPLKKKKEVKEEK